MSLDAQIALTMKEIERYQEEIALLEKDTLSSKEACEKFVNYRFFRTVVVVSENG